MLALIAYSALVAMLIDGVPARRFRLNHPDNARTPRALHLYSRYAYLRGVITFMTGGLLVIFDRTPGRLCPAYPRQIAFLKYLLSDNTFVFQNLSAVSACDGLSAIELCYKRITPFSA